MTTETLKEPITNVNRNVRERKSQQLEQSPEDKHAIRAATIIGGILLGALVMYGLIVLFVSMEQT